MLAPAGHWQRKIVDMMLIIENSVEEIPLNTKGLQRDHTR
jgi:hypothetical protein